MAQLEGLRADIPAKWQIYFTVKTDCTWQSFSDETHQNNALTPFCT